jgi:hypothetical protein
MANMAVIRGGRMTATFIAAVVATRSHAGLDIGLAVVKWQYQITPRGASVMAGLT